VAKSGGSNYGLIFGIGAVIGIGVLLKIVIDHNSQLIAQEEKIQTLSNQVVELKTNFEVALGTIDTKIAASRLEALDNAKAPTTQVAVVENPYLIKTPAKMTLKATYYCQTETEGKSTIVYFDGNSAMKAWSDTDGTLAFVKSKPATTTGTYKISNGYVYFSLVQQGQKLNRRAAILGVDESGVITELDYYSNIYSSLACPF